MSGKSGSMGIGFGFVDSDVFLHNECGYEKDVWNKWKDDEGIDYMVKNSRVVPIFTIFQNKICI